MREQFIWSMLTYDDHHLICSILGENYYSVRQPDLIIAPHGKPYLYRWYVAPRNDHGNVYLHVQVGDDADREYHDHPWDNQSVILAGGYDEHNYLGSVQRRRVGDVIQRKATFAHRLTMIPGVPYSISLFSTGPKRRTWGFYDAKGWWSPYTDHIVTQDGVSVQKEYADV